jgi:hypothetical protein
VLMTVLLASFAVLGLGYGSAGRDRRLRDCRCGRSPGAAQ